MSELITEIFTKVLMLGKSNVGTVIIDSNNTVNNVNNLYSQHEQIALTIEQPINNIFTTYYKQNSTKIIARMSQNIIDCAPNIDAVALEQIQSLLLSKFTNLL